jgi:hypothetical protein
MKYVFEASAEKQPSGFLKFPPSILLRKAGIKPNSNFIFILKENLG